MPITFIKLYLVTSMKTKENISLTIDKEILSKSREIANKDGLDFSSYVEQLLREDILKVKNEVV